VNGLVNTYKDNVEPTIKIAEELRLIRCIMERELSNKHPHLFVDYQMEKFGKEYKS